MIKFLKSLGPGLLFAGAAIGVSHLVQSTRAGAEFGFGLLWALILVHLFKYPFFQYGPRYATATGESLLDGYKRLGKGVLITYFVLNMATMFTIQAAVTIVTAGLAINLFGMSNDPITWSIVITIIGLCILIIGRYKLLDNLMKIIILILTITTVASVLVAIFNTNKSFDFTQILPKETLQIGFLIAFLGWMPAPLDVSIWQSLWAIEKKKDESTYDTKKSIFDFNIGYFGTLVLGICFLSLGTIVLYTGTIGESMYLTIGIAAFTTMFSTTLTTLDASPRAMTRTVELLTNKISKKMYWFWIGFLSIGTIIILKFFLSEMGTLIKIATILSFLTAPFYAIINFTLISGKHTPQEWHPSIAMKILSYLGIIFLIGFSAWYLMNL
jgi:Mn2+/Fe2+ NRAMP family transporter